MKAVLSRMTFGGQCVDYLVAADLESVGEWLKTIRMSFMSHSHVAVASFPNIERLAMSEKVRKNGDDWHVTFHRVYDALIFQKELTQAGLSAVFGDNSNKVIGFWFLDEMM